MSSKNDKARKELDAILAGLMTDKKKKQSDKMLIAKAPGGQWHKSTAERNRRNANNKQIIDKITNANKGKRYTFLSEETQLKLTKAGWQPFVTPHGIFPCKKYADEYYFNNNLTPCKVLGSVTQWLRRAIIKHKDEFYYITKEEYTKLTGKDPWNE